MTELSARDVIARAVVDQEAPEGVWNAYVASYPGNQKRADAIIDALHEAGYAIVQRDAPMPPTPGPFNPFGKQDHEQERD